MLRLMIPNGMGFLSSRFTLLWLFRTNTDMSENESTTPTPANDKAEERLQAAACSPEVAERLYALLEYYFEYAPTTYGMSRERYLATAEGKRTLEALEAYRKETGAEDTYAHSMFRENA